jgi:hypothetical protein
VLHVIAGVFAVTGVLALIFGGIVGLLVVMGVFVFVVCPVLFWVGVIAGALSPLPPAT